MSFNSRLFIDSGIRYITVVVMKIKFYWYFYDVEQHKLIPAVEIKCLDEKTINCLHGVLTDDAGINSITWLEKGVELLRELKIAVIPHT